MKKHHHLLHQGHRICVTVRTSGSCFCSRKYETEDSSCVSSRANRAFPRKTACIPADRKPCIPPLSIVATTSCWMRATQALHHQVPCEEVGQAEPEDARRHVGWPQLRREQLLTAHGAVGWWATRKTWWNQFFYLMVRQIFWFHQVLFMVQTNLAVQLSTVEEIFGLNVFGELCE